VGILKRRFKQLALIGLGATGILAACSSNSGSSGSTGGASAKGGSTGSGGASASSGGVCSGTDTLFDFSSGDQGWVFNAYQAKDATTGDAVSPYNLVVEGNLSGGDLDAGVQAPTLAADSTVGDPPGSLKVVVTFTGSNQQVNPNINWGQNALQDWTNKVVSVDVKIDPFPSDTTNIGGIMLYAQDTTWVGQYGGMTFPTDNAWHTYTLDMTGTTSVNPAEIIQFTVQLASAGTPTAPFAPTTVTAYIDNITVSGNAGSGGCGGGSTAPASGGTGGSNATTSGGGGTSTGGSGGSGISTGGSAGGGTSTGGNGGGETSTGGSAGSGGEGGAVGSGGTTETSTDAGAEDAGTEFDGSAEGDGGLVDSFVFEDGGTSDAADAPSSSCTVISGGSTGNFGTADAYCFVTCDDIAGWGCSNADGRTVSVNGTVASCSSPLTAVNGRYQFEVTAGTYTYASIYWWGTYRACSTH